MGKPRYPPCERHKYLSLRAAISSLCAFYASDCHSQSPDIDIPATKSALITGSSARTIMLLANHRNPFMRQTQNPHEASEPYNRQSWRKDAVRVAEWGIVGLVTGLAHTIAKAIAAGKNNKCVSTSQWRGFQRRFRNGFCF